MTNEFAVNVQHMITMLGHLLVFPPVPARRPIGFVVRLALGALFAGIPPAMAQASARLAEAARWAVRSALPDGIDDWPVFSGIRLQLHIDAEGRRVVLACGTLEFADPSAGRTHFLVLLDPEARDWRQPLAAPTFFGPRSAQDAVPMAALCEGAGRQQSPDADLHTTVAVPP